MARFYDTLLWEYIKNPWVRWLWLDKIAARDFDYEMISYDDITTKKKLNFYEVDLEEGAIYSGEDVYMTSKLFKRQKEEGILENKVLKDIEIPLVSVLKDTEITGVKINRDILKWLDLLLAKEVEYLEKKIHNEAWEEFNIKSPKQVWEILFDKMWLPKGKKTKTGWSVSADVLWELSSQYEIAEDIVNYRHYTKIRSTYIDWLLDIADDNDLVHTSYNQSVTSTGRLSSTKPNLQNIPSSDGIAWDVRKAFVSRFKNWSLMAADYSQVEVRLLANMSSDKNLISAFNSWLDIHHKTAEFIFWKSEISNSERKIAKAVNFWVIYGISSFGLAKMINISIKEARIYIDRFYEWYPKVKIFLDETIKFCEDNWYVETLFGRKRYIAGINDSNRMIKSSAEREAINMPIQWTSADIIKIAMIRVSDFMKENNLKSLMIMQVHDELVFDVYPWEEQFLKENVLNIMQSVLTNSEVSLKVDAKIWKDWKETK